MKMLAKPTPIEDTSSQSHPGPGSILEGQRQHSQSPSTLMDSGMAPEPRQVVPVSLDHNVDRQPVGNISVPAHFASTYLATMYPFSWTAADCDVFWSLESCRELFTEHDLEEFDLDSVLTGGRS